MRQDALGSGRHAWKLRIACGCFASWLWLQRKRKIRAAGARNKQVERQIGPKIGKGYSPACRWLVCQGLTRKYLERKCKAKGKSQPGDKINANEAQGFSQSQRNVFVCVCMCVRVVRTWVCTC